jgi:hypothetical protein
VPLALAYWSQQGIQFVDMWSARRPVISTAASDDWPIFSSRRRWTEGLAMFLQFQDQMQALQSGATSLLAASTTQVDQLFFYLPPVGLLPISGIASPAGVNYPNFLASNTYRHPQFLEGARLQALMCEAFAYPPLNVNDQVMVWLYWLRENFEAINAGQQSSPNSYVVFATGQTPNFGDPRYDVNRWDYSTYA